MVEQFYAIVRPMVEHNNGRLHPIDRTPPATHDDVSVLELYDSLPLRRSSGTSWNFIVSLMERNNDGSLQTRLLQLTIGVL